MIKKIILSAFFMAGISALYAQNLSNKNLFFLNPFLNSPSFIGEGRGTNIFGHYRNQYADFNGAPVNQMLTFDHAFSEKSFGIGAKVYSENLGIMSNSGFELAYAYRVTLSKDWYMKLGLAGVIGQKSVDFDKAVVADPNEASLQQGLISSTLFDANFGVSLHHEKFRIGLAVPQIIQSDVSFEGIERPEYLSFKNRRAYQVFTDYKVDISKSVMLQPAVFARYIEQSSFTYDVSLVAHIKELFFIGAAYHNDYAASATVGVNVIDGLSFAYNYSLPINDISIASYGGHELMLGYTLGQGKLSGSNSKNGSRSKQTVNTDLYEERFFEQDLQNVQQREEIARLKSLLKNKDLDSELEAIKATSLKRLQEEKQNDKYYVVLASFSDLANANAYQQALKRKSSSINTRVIKQDGWFFVYQKEYDTSINAKRAISEAKQKGIYLKEPWILVLRN